MILTNIPNNRIQINNRNEAYSNLNITRKQYENCLLPLWKLGNATAQEIAEYLNRPINEIIGRFTECYGKGLIIEHPKIPIKTYIYPHKKTHRTNYILTEKGKEIIRQIGGNDASY